MFKLRYDVHSTIYPQDTSINSLFETFYKSDASAEEELLAVCGPPPKSGVSFGVLYI